MRRASQTAIRRLAGLQLAASSTRTATAVGLQQQQGLHSSGNPEAPASSAQPAYAEEELQHRTVSLNFHEGRLQIDDWGAVSNIPKDDPAPHLRQAVQPSAISNKFVNHDGQRGDDGRYKAFLNDVASVVPKKRVYTDPLHLLAYGSDASFYRLLPKAVIKVHNEQEVQQLLQLSQRHKVPVTFRAAGTSLSGQAITDSVIIRVGYVGKNFRGINIQGDGSKVTAEVGLLGGEVNKLLAAHASRNKLPISHRIGPDPASIDAAMIGGIVANNASGMCCGVAQNTYHTMADMKIILADGTVLDTADEESRKSFMRTHASVANAVSDLAREVQADQQLTARIKAKYKIKNTVGYSLNALVDFPPDDPITIIKHLMVGSEGTLGFISNVTYNTVREVHHKASAFVLFPDINSACDSVQKLKATQVASAVELVDYNSLRLAQAPFVALVAELAQAQEGAAGLLIEVKGETREELQERIQTAQRALTSAGVQFDGQRKVPLGIESYPFRFSPEETKVFWDFRKGLIPIIGGSRSVGTSMMIEDVVCPVEHLADMTQDLIQLFTDCGYKDFSAVGHALEGNLHLVFAQGFRTPEEVATFGKLLSGMADIVVHKYNGSLKGEHGTGRNMAPFVELEWGSRAMSYMRRIKHVFDPHNLLNPGVIINEDPAAHLQFLKPSPPASSLIDNCMECGYCEAFCLSRDLTITPRQRIQTYREITRLRGLPSPSKEQKERLTRMEDVWQYDGDSTCAVDGMCAVRCPVNINTGEFTKQLRTAAVDGLDPAAGAASASTSSRWGSKLAINGANHFKMINNGVPYLLNTVDFFHGLLGPRVLEVVSGTMNKWSNHIVPQWNKYIPKGGQSVKSGLSLAPAAALPTEAAKATQSGIPRQVVFLPTCVNRMMGAARGDANYSGSTLEVFTNIAHKAGYQVIVPEGISGLCCGMMFDSRGAKKAAGMKTAEAITALSLASQMGKLPIVIDNSPCLAQLKSAGLNQKELK
eukprot:GHUV01006940.1.p1 GENE.GHUV01006940.1~~GHUV01006940.1.p1  ORF type:complete len:990 (+),score=266.56 GHUV01006940.1:206-3175(+)